MYFDDTTTSITITSFDEDRIQILDGKQRLEYFADNFRSQPVHLPLSEKHMSFFKKMRRMLKK
jgi:hypothetical protein